MRADKWIKKNGMNVNFWQLDVPRRPGRVAPISEPLKILPDVLFITSFPPRECGIATYSVDLMNALKTQFGSSFSFSVCALESDNEQYEYAQKPKFILNTDGPTAFENTALAISNDLATKLVVIQHEFGFFAKNKTDFMRFVHHIRQPIVFVFHTVLPDPNAELRAEIQAIANKAASVVVMTKNAAAILKRHYGLSDQKITIIPHGTHLVPPADREQLKALYQYSGKKVLSTFGLLGKSKSIETSLDALPRIIRRHPDVMFLMLGKTHPSVLKNDGEAYRNTLEAKVKALKLEKHVTFVNEYLALPILLEYLQLSDVYLFTSKDPNQAVSGTFAYAASCGCPVISTPIPHAKEVLSNNNGIIIDFENSEQLAAAVISLLDNDALRAEMSSHCLHQMAFTAWQNSAILHARLFKQLTSPATDLLFKWPKIKLSRIKKMTTDFGMIQFSKIAIPDIKTGYTLDDNARAMLALAQHYELYRDESDVSILQTYLNFISFCLQDDGTFLNYVNEEKSFSDQNFEENLEDSNGRAIWALGYVASLKDVLPPGITQFASELLEKAIRRVDAIHSTRAMAFIIKGLYYQNEPENRALLELFANRLTQMYRHEKRKDWFWFENYLTYGNSLLPEALLCAYISTENEVYKDIAIESLDFLMSHIFENNKIKVISNRGWHVRDGNSQKSVGGEQPIDVAYTIITLEKFYATLKRDLYRRNAVAAFNWFLGANHLNQIVYNPCTGGCYDGVEEHNVNLNQGAESTLSYLLARLSIQRIKAFEIQTSGAQRIRVAELAPV